jgi:transcriptional regulator with XRE-family HTH domain
LLSGNDLIAARRKKGWTQAQAAGRLGVSQPYLSMLEAERRPVPPRLFKRVLHIYTLGPLSLPFLENADTDPSLLAADLGGLGCPTFIHLHPRRWLNPAQVLLLALLPYRMSQKIAEALPWLAVEYAELDWRWLVDRAKLADRQNRLGFVLALADQLATLRRASDVGWHLRQIEGIVENSRLAVEDEVGLGRVTDGRREWLRVNRSAEARRWNVISELRLDHLEKYVAPDYY